MSTFLNEVVSLKYHFLLLFPCNFFIQLDIICDPSVQNQSHVAENIN